MHKIFIFTFIISYVLSSQYVPIQKTQIGFFIGSKEADVKIQLVYDPSCDDSLAFDNTFQKAWNSLNQTLKDKISLRFIPLTLLYHISSNKLSQALNYIQQKLGNQQAITFFRDSLTNWETYDEKNLRNQTINGLMIKIAQRVNSFFGLKVQDTLKQLLHGSNSQRIAKQWSKVVMGSMRVSGTPKFRINGVVVDGATEMKSWQLVSLIESLF